MLITIHYVKWIRYRLELVHMSTQIYNWNLYTNGAAHVARLGFDFQTSPKTFRQQVLNRARVQGMSATTSILSDGNVLFQFRQKYGASR